MYFAYNCPVYVEFGENASHRVGQIAHSMNHRRILLVTDRGIVAAGLLDPVIDSLQKKKIEHVVFDRVEPNPKDVTVDFGLRVLKEEKCDSVIAVGGGSSLDVGKAIAMLATNAGNISDFEIRSDKEVLAARVKKHSLPLFTIPTTAGTGSEVDFWAVISNTSTRFKMLVGQAPLCPGGPYMGATVALVDPLMTMSLPARQTASTGIDAFFHGVESFLSPVTPPMFRCIALDVAELALEWLPRAYEDGRNREAREKMMLAAHLGGLCISFGGLGAIHAIAEAIGGVNENVPHGCALASIALCLLRSNLSALRKQYSDFETRMHPQNARLREDKAAESFLETVSSLIHAVDLPDNIRDLGVKPQNLSDIAERACMAIEISSNPRKLEKEDVLELLKTCF